MESYNIHGRNRERVAPGLEEVGLPADPVLLLSTGNNDGRLLCEPRFTSFGARIVLSSMLGKPVGLLKNDCGNIYTKPKKVIDAKDVMVFAPCSVGDSCQPSLYKRR